MKYIVDRITEGIVVLEQEDGGMVRFPLAALPQGVKEGSVLHEEDGVFSLSESETDERRNTLFDLQNALFGEDEEEETSGGESEEDDFFSYADNDE